MTALVLFPGRSVGSLFLRTPAWHQAAGSDLVRIYARRVRALLICHSPAYEILGGGEKSLLTMAQRWRERYPEWELIFVVPASDGLMAPAVAALGFECLQVQSYPWVLRVPAEGARTLRYQRQNAAACSQLVSLIEERQIDLVVTNTIVSPWGAVAAKLSGIAHAWLVREFGDLDHGLRFQFGAEQTWRDINLLSDLVVANSHAISAHVERMAPGNSVAVAYPPVAVPKSLPSQREDVVTTDHIKLLCLGTLSESKGQLTAIEAVSRMAIAGRHVKLVLAGASSPPTYNEFLIRRAAELGVSEQISFLGSVGNPDELIDAADICLTPSLMEAFGRVTLEYMLHSKPVIGTNTGGTPELIDAGQTGYLIDPRSSEQMAIALSAYDQDRQLILEHGRNGLKKAHDLVVGPTSMDSLLEALVALPTNRRSNSRLPALVVAQMREAGRALQTIQEHEQQILDSREYRVGRALMNPLRTVKNRVVRITGSATTGSGHNARVAPLRSTPAMAASKTQATRNTTLTELAKDLVVAAALCARRLVDKSYYAGLAQRRFTSRLGASIHFVRTGLYKDLAPSPRFEPNWTAVLSSQTPAQATRYVALHGVSSMGSAWSPPPRASATRTSPNETADAKTLARFDELPLTLNNPTNFFGPDDRLETGRITRFPSNDVTGIEWPMIEDQISRRDRGLVSVLMLTYNDWQRTISAVDAVRRNSTEHRFEVVLIDNGSRAHVRRILRAYFADAPDVRFIALPLNLNFAAGNNVAFSVSRGSRIVLLNNDTEVHKGWLSPLLAALESPTVLGVQPLLVYENGTIQSAGTVFDRPNTLPRHFLTDHPTEDIMGLPGHALEGFAALTAACLVLRAEDFAEVHGFDELFANGLEDVDLCLRMLAKGTGKFQVVRGARVTHYEGKSEGRGNRTLQNRIRFWRRWAGQIPMSDDWRYAPLGLTVSGFQPLDSKMGQLGVVYGVEPQITRRHSAIAVAVGRVAVRMPVIDKAHRFSADRPALIAELAEALSSIGAMAIFDSPGSRNRGSRSLDNLVIHFSFDAELNIQPGALNVLLREGDSPDSIKTLFMDATFQLKPSAQNASDGKAAYLLPPGFASEIQALLAATE